MKTTSLTTNAPLVKSQPKRSVDPIRFSIIGNTFKKIPAGWHLWLTSYKIQIDMVLWQFIKKHKVLLAHAGIWVGFLLLWSFTLLSVNPNKSENIFRMLITFLPAAYAFYGSNFIFFRLLPQRQPWVLAATHGAFFLSCYVVLSLTVRVWRPMAYGQEVLWPTKPMDWLGSLWNETFWLYVLLSALSLGYYYLRQSGKRTKELKVTLAQKLEAEKGKLEAEYAFLRAQINPHFLHNTLNFFYAKSLGHSDELSEGILTLCDIMRYSLESDEDANGTVLLAKEVEHLHNVIKINQLRFSNRLQIDFQLQGELHGLRMIPLVLITLVENAFKHGEMNDPEHPIQIRLQVREQGILHFNVANKKRKGPKETSHGIGLDNTRKRLVGAYGPKHTLEVQEDENFYSISLLVPLVGTNASKTEAPAEAILSIS